MYMNVVWVLHPVRILSLGGVRVCCECRFKIHGSAVMSNREEEEQALPDYFSMKQKTADAENAANQTVKLYATSPSTHNPHALSNGLSPHTVSMTMSSNTRRSHVAHDIGAPPPPPMMGPPPPPQTIGPASVVWCDVICLEERVEVRNSVLPGALRVILVCNRSHAWLRCYLS